MVKVVILPALDMVGIKSTSSSTMTPFSDGQQRQQQYDNNNTTTTKK